MQHFCINSMIRAEGSMFKRNIQMKIGKTLLKLVSFYGVFCAAVLCKPSKLRLDEPFHCQLTDKRPTDEQSEKVLELVSDLLSECKNREELVEIDRNN